MKTQTPKTSWHSKTIEASLTELKSSITGLDNNEIGLRQKEYGRNSLPTSARQSLFIRFLLQFHNILIYVLLACALITAVLNHWLDTLVILAVVVANALIGIIQEGKAEKAMESIHQMLAPHATVLRNGERQSINAQELVPGDIVLLEAGDRIPADLRLLQTYGLSVQEAILTGESMPVEKHTNPVADNVPLGDRSGMAFSGTLVASGTGKGLVVGTGTDTEIGRISGLLASVETLSTPLVQQMSVFAKWLTIIILLIATLLFGYVYFVGSYDFTELFMAVVGLSVAAIPEGLPAILTITLAIAVQAMARRNAIVRRLPAIETIGSVSVICTDKTGTLTRNEMVVTSVLTAKHLFTLAGTGYEPQGQISLQDKAINPAEHEVLEHLARSCVLCNDAILKQLDDQWSVEGDPMEGALLACSGKIGLDALQEQKFWTRSDAIPFDAKHRYMATLNHDEQSQAYIFVKGAPERILAMCNTQRASSGEDETIDPDYWHGKINEVAALGQRVLAFAMRKVESEHKTLAHQDLDGALTLLGMVGMIDPPRTDAITAVSECHAAGIRVKMITGDHAKTAIAIGKQVGLDNPDTVLTGAEIDNLSDAMLKDAVLNCDIFARTSPEHKLRLVMALQSHGLTVAMTGDGVNDTPALKRADIGIAMGRKGSEAAKEAAELVLADDNFASIVAAVREGRTVYSNIKKVISWTLPTSAGEALTVIVALLFGLTLPIIAIQILWVNLITTVTLGLALAFEPTEAATMQHPPRPRHEPLLGGDLVWHIVLVSVLFLGGVYSIFSYAIDRGYSLDLARTLAVNTLVVMEIFHLLFIRNISTTTLTWQNVRGTKVVWLTIIIITVAQFAITYLPFMQTLFSTQAVALKDGMLVLAIGIALFAIVEIEKQIRLRLKASRLS